MPIIAAPAALEYEQASLRAVDTVAETRSVYSGAESRLDFGGEWWELTLVTIPMQWGDAAEIAAWCDRLRDADATAQIDLSSLTTRLGTTAAATITLTSGAAAGQRSVAVTGLGAGKTLLAGSFIATAANRLHRLRQSVTASGTGAATLDLFPRLRDALSTSAVLTIGAPAGLWRLQGRPGHDWSAPQFGSLVAPKSLTFVEAL